MLHLKVMPKNPIFEAATQRQTHIIYIASLLGDYESRSTILIR